LRSDADVFEIEQDEAAVVGYGSPLSGALACSSDRFQALECPQKSGIRLPSNGRIFL